MEFILHGKFQTVSIQDIKMRSLIKHEPITPFTERVRELYEAVGVSSVLVIGGSGEFLSVADQIILMDNFVPKNVTQEAKSLCEHDKQQERIPLTKWEIDRKITAETNRAMLVKKGIF